MITEEKKEQLEDRFKVVFGDDSNNRELKDYCERANSSIWDRLYSSDHPDSFKPKKNLMWCCVIDQDNDVIHIHSNFSYLISEKVRNDKNRSQSQLEYWSHGVLGDYFSLTWEEASFLIHSVRR